MSFVDEDGDSSYLVVTRDGSGSWDGFVEVQQRWVSPEAQCLGWDDPRTGQEYRAYYAWADVAWQVLRDLPGIVEQLTEDGSDESALFLSLWPGQDEKGMTAEQLVGGQVHRDGRMPDLVVTKRPDKEPKVTTAPWIGELFTKMVVAQSAWDEKRRSDRPAVRNRIFVRKDI